VHAFERFLKLENRLLRLQFSPHGECPTQEPALLLEAIVFDHPLDALEPIACVAMRNWHHSASVLPTATPKLSPIAHRSRCLLDLVAQW